MLLPHLLIAATVAVPGQDGQVLDVVLEAFETARVVAIGEARCSNRCGPAISEESPTASWAQ